MRGLSTLMIERSTTSELTSTPSAWFRVWPEPAALSPYNPPTIPPSIVPRKEMVPTGLLKRCPTGPSTPPTDPPARTKIQ
jgi:hypothetical protein